MVSVWGGRETPESGICTLIEEVPYTTVFGYLPIAIDSLFRKMDRYGYVPPPPPPQEADGVHLKKMVGGGTDQRVSVWGLGLVGCVADGVV